MLGVASSNPAYQPAVERLRAALSAIGIPATEQVVGLSADETADIHLRIDPQSHSRPQAYRLRVGRRGIEIDSAD